MLNSEKIIERIREDAPCVYNILHEETCPIDSFANTPEEWDGFYTRNPDLKPTPDKLLKALTEYSGDNYDVHYWEWRYAQMLEDSNRQPIRVPFTESDINDLQEWEHFHWTYDGVPLFIFNTDSTPQFDPESPYFDPAITV